MTGESDGVAPGCDSVSWAAAGAMPVATTLSATKIADDDPLPKGVVQAIVEEAAYALPVGEVIDIDQERARLERELHKLSGEIGKIDAKLTNQNFVSRAPEDVVEEQRERLDELQQSRSKLFEALERLVAA